MAFSNPSDVPNLTAWELLTVVALAEHGSFVATSAYLNTSQPAVTRTLKRLEQRLGVTLFARSTRHVEITPAGREFVAVAERVLHDLQITVRSMRDIGTEQRGQVIVSTYSAFAYNVLPPILQAYRETRPQIDVRLREGRQADIGDERLVSLPVDSLTRRMIDGAAATAGLHMRHSLVVTRFESVITYVRAGAGIGIIPAGALPVPAPSGFHAA